MRHARCLHSCCPRWFAPAIVLCSLSLVTSHPAEATVFVIWLEAETAATDVPDADQSADRPEVQPDEAGTDLLYRIGGNLQQRFQQWIAPNPHVLGPLTPPVAIAAVIEAVDAKASDKLYLYRELRDWSTRIDVADDGEISETEFWPIARQSVVDAWVHVRLNVNAAQPRVRQTAQELAHRFRDICRESSEAVLAAADIVTSPEAWSDARWTEIAATDQSYVQLIPTYNEKYYGQNECEYEETDEYGYEYEEDYAYEDDYGYEPDEEYEDQGADAGRLKSVLVPSGGQADASPATAASLIRPVLSNTAEALDSLSCALANLSARLHVAADTQLPTASARTSGPRR